MILIQSLLFCLFPDKVLPWRMLPAHQPVHTVEATLLLHGPTPAGKDRILVTVLEHLLRKGFRLFEGFPLPHEFHI